MLQYIRQSSAAFFFGHSMNHFPHSHTSKMFQKKVKYLGVKNKGVCFPRVLLTLKVTILALGLRIDVPEET